MRKHKALGIALLALLLLAAASCTLPAVDSTLDTDGDGWTDTRERAAKTNPNNVDSDADGYWDPLDPNPLDPNIPVPVEQQRPTATPSTPAATPATPTPAPRTTAVSPQDAAARELQEVQSAVAVMMRNNGLEELPNPVTEPTDDMHRFPDATTRHGASGVGYVLYLHDIDGDGRPDTNYIRVSQTQGTYTSDRLGNVTQVTSG